LPGPCPAFHVAFFFGALLVDTLEEDEHTELPLEPCTQAMALAMRESAAEEMPGVLVATAREARSSLFRFCYTRGQERKGGE
jgi:hypothetical protein